MGGVHFGLTWYRGFPSPMPADFLLVQGVLVVLCPNEQVSELLVAHVDDLVESICPLGRDVCVL